MNVKLHRRAKIKLEDEVYVFVPHDLLNFLEALNDQSTELQWFDDDVNMMIQIEILNANTDFVNLLTNNGEVILDVITKFEETYIRTESRPSKNTNVLYNCLMNSRSKVSKSKVSGCNSEYKFNRLPLVNILFKAIIWEIHLDNNNTTKSTRTKLSSLYYYIGTIGCNITKFKDHVKFFLTVLSSSGGESMLC